MSLETTTCSSCGATIPDDAVFCTRCGAQVRVPEAPAREAPAGSSAAGDTVLERPRAAGPQAHRPPDQAPRAVRPPDAGPRAAQVPAAPPLTGHAPARAAPPPSGDLGDAPPAAPGWVVPPPPAPTGASGGAAHGRLPRWALAAVVVAAIAVAAAVALILVLGSDSEPGQNGEAAGGAVAVTSPSASPSPSASASPSASTSPDAGGATSGSPSASTSPSLSANPSPQPSISPGAETEAEQLTRFLAEVRPILKKWTRLDKKLSHALWQEAHQRRDATWPPAGRKIQALTDSFNPITAALWRVDTPAFMQPAMRDLLGCARLEHRAYDKAAAMLISGDWKNKTWQKMSGAANKTWRAYLAKRDREKERLGLVEE